jgi:dTDP-glucose pyrophosphorylase
MDSTGFRSLIVLDENQYFVGILSLGDIQRAIIKNVPLKTMVSNILRPNPKIAREETPLEQIKAVMLRYRMEFMPVVDRAKKVTLVYKWEDLFPGKKMPPFKQFNLPVVIMAGGLGTRLKPLTNVIPKALIPIGEKTMMEEIFDRFSVHGCNTFYISVNYKAELIEFYLKNEKLPCRIEFFKEEKTMGTAGSLSLIKDKIHGTFFVNNCDILIEQDYSEILDFHREINNEITIVAALKHYPIPYGTLETTNNGALVSMTEKPELTLKINSGMYILEKNVLEEIPDNNKLDFNNLIESVRQKGGRVGVFPVSEKSWQDIGDWKEYLDKISV